MAKVCWSSWAQGASAVVRNVLQSPGAFLRVLSSHTLHTGRRAKGIMSKTSPSGSVYCHNDKGQSLTISYNTVFHIDSFQDVQSRVVSKRLEKEHRAHHSPMRKEVAKCDFKRSASGWLAGTCVGRCRHCQDVATPPDHFSLRVLVLEHLWCRGRSCWSDWRKSQNPALPRD